METQCNRSLVCYSILAEVVEECVWFGDGEGGDVGCVGRVGETERGKLLALFDGDLVG